jgi:hypothetical protein
MKPSSGIIDWGWFRRRTVHRAKATRPKPLQEKEGAGASYNIDASSEGRQTLANKSVIDSGTGISCFGMTGRVRYVSDELIGLHVLKCMHAPPRIDRN